MALSYHLQKPYLLILGADNVIISQDRNCVASAKGTITA